MFNEKKIQRIINSKDKVRLVIALGYPKEDYSVKEKTRKAFEEHIYFV